jgi:hypothetical protein
VSLGLWTNETDGPLKLMDSLFRWTADTDDTVDTDGLSPSVPSVRWYNGHNEPQIIGLNYQPTNSFQSFNNIEEPRARGRRRTIMRPVGQGVYGP